MLPYPKRGDAEADTTYAAVGRALSAWEIFERQLANLFAAFVGDREDQFPAIRAYGAIMTFRARTDMLAAASEAHFARLPNATLEKTIRDLIGEATEFSPRRNEIAHGFVNGWRPEGAPASDKGFVLMPFPHSPRKSKFIPGSVAFQVSPPRPALRPQYLYSSVEISVYRAAFDALTMRAVHLPAQIERALLKAEEKEARPQ